MLLNGCFRLGNLLVRVRIKQTFSDWEPVMQEARQSRYALMQVSERKWAVLQRREGFQALGNDRVGVNQYEIRPGCGKLSYFEAQEEFLKLRRAERVFDEHVDDL